MRYSFFCIIIGAEEREIIMDSEFNLYKLSDERFVFSVKCIHTGTIRYYQVLLDDTCHVWRIKDSFSFFSQLNLSNLDVTDDDYQRVISKLIFYCENGIRENRSRVVRRRAYDYSKFVNGSKEDDLKRLLQVTTAEASEARYDWSCEIDGNDKLVIAYSLVTRGVGRYYK